MITNDAEHEVVVQQIARLDAAIEDMRQNILPKNERTFKLFTEAPLEMRREMQKDVDAYLSKAKPQHNGIPTRSESMDTKSLELT